MMRGASAVQLKGGTSSNIRSGASGPAERQTHTHAHTQMQTETQKDRWTQTHEETQRLRGTTHACPLSPSLSLDKARSPLQPLHLSQRVSGGLVGPHPKGESQASTLGLFWGMSGWRLAVRRFLQYWAVRA